MSEYQPRLQQSLSLLRSGDAQKAFRTFRPVLSYPGLVEQPAEFSETLQAFAEISMQIGEAQFASRLCTADRSCGLAHLYQATFSAEQCWPMLYF